MDNTNTIIIFLSCILGLIIFGKILILPIKKMLKILINSILGGLLIMLINWVGVSFNIGIGLNIFTALFVRNFRNSWGNTINYIKTNNWVI